MSLRKRKVEALQVRRANALVALDDGHSVQMVSRIFYLDRDTVRGWLRDFREKGLASVELADYPDREGPPDGGPGRPLSRRSSGTIRRATPTRCGMPSSESLL